MSLKMKMKKRKEEKGKRQKKKQKRDEGARNEEGWKSGEGKGAEGGRESQQQTRETWNNGLVLIWSGNYTWTHSWVKTTHSFTQSQTNLG